MYVLLSVGLREWVWVCRGGEGLFVCVCSF